MNYGLLNGIREASAYILGKSTVPYIPYNETGDWESYLPKYEAQADRFESYGCTEWGLQNQIEILYKLLYGTEPNYDEWFNYALVPIGRGGQDPQITYESARKTGFVPSGTVDKPDSVEEALDKSRISKSMLAKGLNWLVQHDFQHEWLWTSPPTNALELMQDALKTSPLGASVTAWYEENGLFVDKGQRNNHWCVIYKIDDKGIHVFDTYNHSKKILSKDHYIGRVKRIWINKKTKSASRRHVGILESILNILMQKKTLYEVAKSHLGTDVTPKDEVRDDVACAVTVTTLMRELYPETPVIAGTWTLYEYLRDHPKWVQVDAPETGDIIISPTGSGKGSGHTGVCMLNGLIASNNSYGINAGKLTENYTQDVWRRKYAQLATHYFRRMV